VLVSNRIEYWSKYSIQNIEYSHSTSNVTCYDDQPHMMLVWKQCCILPVSERCVCVVVCEVVKCVSCRWSWPILSLRYSTSPPTDNTWRNSNTPFTSRASTKVHFRLTSLCNYCSAAEESASHFLCHCDYFAILRMRIWGKPDLYPADIDIARFIKKSVGSDVKKSITSSFFDRITFHLAVRCRTFQEINV